MYESGAVSPLRTVEVGPVCGIALNSRGLAQAAIATTDGHWTIIDLSTGERLLHGGEGDEGFGCIVWKVSCLGALASTGAGVETRICRATWL